MISQRWRLASIFVTLTNLLALATAQSSCINNGNYSIFSSYKANMETLLSSLATKVDINGFYNTSVGQSPDTVYAAVLCRGDIQPEECRSCIQNATAELAKSCPNYKQAVRWNELCMVRYSNESMLGILRTSPGWSWRSLINASSPDEYMADVSKILDDLSLKASAGGVLRKVAAGNRSSADFQIIFSLVQCTPDLSPENCTSCLVLAAAKIPIFCPNSVRCRLLFPSCNLRYMSLPFYNETRLDELHALAMSSPPPLLPPPQLPPPPVPALLQPPPPPPPPPPGLPQEPPAPPRKKDDNTRTVIIASVSVGVGLLILAVFASVLLIKRKK